MKMTSKGQVTIPKKYRQKLGLHADSEIEFQEKGGKLLLFKAPHPASWVQEWAKRVRGTMMPGMTTEKLTKLTRGRKINDLD